MKKSTFAAILAILIAGPFLMLGCGSTTKKTEAIPTTTEQTANTETAPAKAGPADLGAASAGRSR
jgi:uncharacterized protein YceK